MAKNYSDSNLVYVNSTDIQPGQLVVKIGGFHFVGLGASTQTIAGIHLCGDYSESQVYRKTTTTYDAVQYKGSLWAYINDTPSSGNPPPDSGTYNTYWSLLVSKGDSGQSIVNASVAVSSLTQGYIVVTSQAFPVALKTNLGNLYPVEKGTMTESSGMWSIDPTAYLAYDNVQTFTGPWTVYFAGGLPETMTILNVGTSITPIEHQAYRHILTASDAIVINTSGLTSSQCLTFELWLDMPSTAVAFTLPSGITWIDGTSPDFSAGDTRYVIVIRWNGTGLLASLAYTEALA